MFGFQEDAGDEIKEGPKKESGEGHWHFSSSPDCLEYVSRYQPI